MYIIDKKRRLKECVDHLNSVEETYAKQKRYFDKDAWLQDFITISDITPRQTGTTSAISELFDPVNDLYITHNKATVLYFGQLLFELGKVNSAKPSMLKYLYINQFTINKESDHEKIISLLAKQLKVDVKLDLGIKLPDSIRGKSIDGIVWIDLGSYGMYREYDLIYKIIKGLYAIYPKAKFLIC